MGLRTVKSIIIDNKTSTFNVNKMAPALTEQTLNNQQASQQIQQQIKIETEQENTPVVIETATPTVTTDTTITTNSDTQTNATTTTVNNKKIIILKTEIIAKNNQVTLNNNKEQQQSTPKGDFQLAFEQHIGNNIDGPVNGPMNNLNHMDKKENIQQNLKEKEIELVDDTPINESGDTINIDTVIEELVKVEEIATNIPVTIIKKPTPSCSASEVNLDETIIKKEEKLDIEGELNKIEETVVVKESNPVEIVEEVIIGNEIEAETNNNINQHSSDNNSTMGLQKDYSKENAEMEQMLGVLASSSDLDLLQVFKSLEESTVVPQCGDVDGVDNFHDLALFNEDEVEVMQQLCSESGVEGNNSGVSGGNGGATISGGNLSVSSLCDGNNDADKNIIKNSNCDLNNLEQYNNQYDDIKKCQLTIERKCDFLLRRLKKLQTKLLGEHINNEIIQIFNDTYRLYKRKERDYQKNTSQSSSSSLSVNSLNNQNNIDSDIPPLQLINYNNNTINNKPITVNIMKTFIKKINHVSSTQNATIKKKTPKTSTLTTTPRNGDQITTTTSSSSQQPQINNNNSNNKLVQLIPNLDEKYAENLEYIAGMLKTELGIIEKGIDSDATESSSGGESADEMVSYSNSVQNSLTM